MNPMAISRLKQETKSVSEDIQVLQINLHRGSLSSINREQRSNWTSPRSRQRSLNRTRWQQREIEPSWSSPLKGDFDIAQLDEDTTRVESTAGVKTLVSGRSEPPNMGRLRNWPLPTKAGVHPHAAVRAEPQSAECGQIDRTTRIHPLSR